MSKLHDMLAEVRAKPGVILGQKSVHALYAFVSGYLYAQKEIDDTSAFTWLASFGNWVRKRYGVQSSQGWGRIIAFYSTDEADELDLFWRLYDEFKQAHPANGQGKRPISGRRSSPKVAS